MEVKNEKTIKIKLTKKDIRKSWWIWYLGAELSSSYERLQSLVFCASMIPILKKLYTDKAELSNALKRHLSFFNTEAIVGSSIHGITIAMEEQASLTLGQDQDQDAVITNIKTGLMGPIAGIGDSIIWGAMMPIIIALFLPFGKNGSIFGAIMPILLYSGITILLGIIFSQRGYLIGRNSIMELLQNGQIKNLIEGAAVLGLFMMGALAASYIKVTTPFEIILENSKPVVLQDIFNSIVPGMLELIAVFSMFFYMKRKGPKYNTIMLFIVIISMIFSFFNLL